MNWKNYLSELKRRHVVKGGIAYLVFSWLITQVLSILIPAFELSPSLLRTTIIILIIGFPISVIISWIYDFSPKGIKRTDSITYDPKVSTKKNIQLNRVIIGGLSIAIVLLIANQFRMNSDNGDPVYNINYSSSIAVLALTDLSREKDQEYFSDGLSRSIYEWLTKLKDLKVINPKSSFIYKNQEVSISDIGEELKVDYLIEGSVVKTRDNSFRATINLVNTKDASTIWSKSFNQKGEDVLYMYDEIAKEVAKYLKLTIDNEDVRLRKVDPEAYDLYLKAEEAVNLWTDSTTLAAEEYLSKSLKIDDTYAPVWSTLSHVYYKKTYYFSKLRSEDGPMKGIQAAKKAIELDSLLSSGYQWLSDYQWRTRDILGYEKNLNKTLEFAPNNATTIFYAAFCALRTNKLNQAYKLLKKARILDPKNIEINLHMGQLDSYFENYDEAISNFQTHADNMFGDHPIYDAIALNYFYKGNAEKALEIVEKDYFEYYRFKVKSKILYGMGRKEESDIFLEKLKLKDFSISGWANYTDAGLYFDIATIYAFRGDKDAAFEYLNKSLDWIYQYPQWFFPIPELKTLYDDPRWDALLDKIGDEFSYNFKPD